MSKSVRWSIKSNWQIKGKQQDSLDVAFDYETRKEEEEKQPRPFTSIQPTQCFRLVSRFKMVFLSFYSLESYVIYFNRIEIILI